MKCRKCGNNISEDAMYCSFCGCKIKKNSTGKTKIITFFAAIIIFIAFVALTGSIIWALNKGIFFNIQTFIEKPNSSNLFDFNEKKIANNSENVSISIPEFEETKLIYEGFSLTEQFVDDTFYFRSNNNNHIYTSNIIKKENSLLYSRDNNSFLVSKNILYILSNNGISKMNLDNKETNEIIEKNNLVNMYVTEEFIFFAEKNEFGLLNLFRTDLNGKNLITIKTFINNFFIDNKEKTLYFSMYIKSEDYDSKNEYIPFITIDDSNVFETSNFMTLFSCDFAGNSIIKVAEKIRTVENGLTFNNVLFLDNFLSFELWEKGKVNLCIVKADKSKFEIIENIKEYFTHNGDIYFTQILEERPYLYNFIKFNPITNEKKFLTELLGYKSIKLENSKIYIVLDNNRLMTTNLEGKEKKGIIDLSSNYLSTRYHLGEIINIDGKNIYTKDAIVSISGDSLIIIDRYNEEKFIQFNEMDNSQYILGNTYIDMYFSFLSKEELLLGNNIFSLCDINNDGIFELLVGDRNNLISNNPYYNLIKNTKIYTIADNQIKLLNELPNLSLESSISKVIKDNKILSFSNDKDKNFANYYNFIENELVEEMFLKSEFIEGRNIFYKYLKNEYLEISQVEYFDLLNIANKQIGQIKKFDINISDIYKGLYFNDYTKYNDQY